MLPSTKYTIKKHNYKIKFTNPQLPPFHAKINT